MTERTERVERGAPSEAVLTPMHHWNIEGSVRLEHAMFKTHNT